MLNTCVFTGSLGADPEVFYDSEGPPIATFNLAFRATKKKTGWIKVTVFQRFAQIVEKYLHKGARIAITGSLDQHKWETDEGQTRTSYQLIANSIEFIRTDGRGFSEGPRPCFMWLTHIPGLLPWRDCQRNPAIVCREWEVRCWGFSGIKPNLGVGYKIFGVYCDRFDNMILLNKSDQLDSCRFFYSKNISL